MHLEGLQRAPGVREAVRVRGSVTLGTQFRVLLALCPNANYLIWFESFKSHIGEDSVYQ